MLHDILPSDPPKPVKKYVAKLDNFTLARHIKAYEMCADMYLLPTYLTALLHEASKRIDNITESSQP